MKWLQKSVPAPEEILDRLTRTIPEELDPRGFVRREIAAKTIFVMLYGLAVEGEARWIRPTAVTDMTDEQSRRQSLEERLDWLDRAQSPNRPRNVVGRWYGENTREPIRDETLRELINLGAVVERPNLPTTSPKPRYALARDFTGLFDPSLRGTPLDSKIRAWREENLSKTALARIALRRGGAGSQQESVLVKLPNGETRRLDPGPSSELTRSVVESFTSRFFQEPAVVLLSESAQKWTYRDEAVCRAIGLELDVSKTLPDVVLVDLATEPPLLVFVECVISDGEIHARRRSELEALAVKSGYRRTDCAYVTAFEDRTTSLFKRMAASIAWGSFVWFASEPGHIVLMRGTDAEKRVSLKDLSF